MQLSADQVVIFLISISVMLLFARLFGELFIRIKMPPIIGEIFAGIILGPTILGMLSPDFYNWLFPVDNVKIALDGIINLAIILLLLISGIEVDLSVVIRYRKTAFFTGIMGIVIPFIIGFSFSYLFPDLMGIKDEQFKFLFALFMGTALSISALSVIAKTLIDLNLFKTKAGMIIVSSAMFNDIVGWLIFSVILGMMGTSEFGFSVGKKILFIFLFIFVVFFLGRRILNWAINLIQEKVSYPGGILNFILIIGFLGAAFTEYIGVHGIIGAFILGIAIGDSSVLKEETQKIIHQFIINIFAPLFFVSIGLRINFIDNFNIVLILVVITLASFGKIIGCGLGAYWSGSNKRESLLIAFGMNSRGTMEIILGLLALQVGLIHRSVFVALVVMALFTSIIGTPLMKYLSKKKISFKSLIDSEQVLFLSRENKNDTIKILVEAVSKNIKIDEEDIFKELINREELNPTGIANYLAIPHTKAKIEKPIVAVAKHSEGLNFEAADSIPSKIIVLLLIPKDENELQLQLLAEIANKFIDINKVNDLLNTGTREDFADMLKKM